MPRPSPPSSYPDSRSLARSAGNDFLLVYFDGFFNLTSAADGRTDRLHEVRRPRSRQQPERRSSVRRTRRGNGCRRRQGRFSSGRAEPDRHGRGRTEGRKIFLPSLSLPPSLPDEERLRPPYPDAEVKAGEEGKNLSVAFVTLSTLFPNSRSSQRSLRQFEFFLCWRPYSYLTLSCQLLIGTIALETHAHKCANSFTLPEFQCIIERGINSCEMHMSPT